MPPYAIVNGHAPSPHCSRRHRSSRSARDHDRRVAIHPATHTSVNIAGGHGGASSGFGRATTFQLPVACIVRRNGLLIACGWVGFRRRRHQGQTDEAHTIATRTEPVLAEQLRVPNASRFASTDRKFAVPLTKMAKADTKTKSSTSTQKRTTKSKKDPAAPKRPLSAYMFFSQDHRERVKQANPEAGFGDVGRLLGAKWKEMSEAEKKPYNDMATRDKARAEAEKAAYSKRR